MPDEQKKDEQKNDEHKTDSESVLVGAAKALGSAAGKVASLAGAAEEKPVAEQPVTRKRAAKPAAA